MTVQNDPVLQGEGETVQGSGDGGTKERERERG